MKIPATAALALVLLVLPTASSEHPDTGAQSHLSVKALRLGPGAMNETEIYPGPEEGPWKKDMVFVFYLLYVGGEREVRVELLYGSQREVVASWMAQNTESHWFSTRIPYDEGPYYLRYTNLGTEDSYTYSYFDQTCNCVAKKITLPRGWVVLHYDLFKGKEYRIGIPMAYEWGAEASLAKRVGPQSRWPQDFAVVQSTAAVAPAWLNFTVTPQQDERYYVFLFEKQGAYINETGAPVPIDITILFEEKSVEGKTPSPAAATALLGLGLAMGWRRRQSRISNA